MKYDFNEAEYTAIARSMSNGMSDGKFYLWVPDWIEDGEEKEYFVLKNLGTRDDKNYKELYHFTAEYIRNKCCFALSPDAKIVLAGYETKKGVICYSSESGDIIWNNKKIKKIKEIRFNQYDSNIIEVINSKVEIIYLNGLTGEVLDEEELYNVKQVINDMRASKNGKYLICSDSVKRGKAVYTVYDTINKQVKGRFPAQGQLNSDTFDVTDNGKYAVCSAYQRQGVSLINISTGEIIWTKKLKDIMKVYFDKQDKNVVVCCRYDYNYTLNISSGETISEDNNEKMERNLYGDDFKFPEDDIVIIGSRQIKSTSFSFLDVIGTPHSVIVNPTEEGIMCYDLSGELLWENKDVEIGEIVYQEDTDTICGTVNIYNQGKIVILSAGDGSVLCEYKTEDYGYTFIDRNNTLVCNTGKMYDVSNKEIKVKNEEFEFKIK
ncbi:MAG: hypothetical protein HDT39_05920 [Lachnospiraceae bacterium]|nr:hypothetical protein [Lachnospiraceae bacterium]